MASRLVGRRFLGTRGVGKNSGKAPRTSSELADVIESARRRRERVDSVDALILEQRALHRMRIANAPRDSAVVAEIRKLKVARTKGWHSQKRAEQLRVSIGARLGFEATEVGRSSGLSPEDIPSANPNSLPEVAIFGHSNCGKSALLNALTGDYVRKGKATVNARAGWTMRLHYYWARPKFMLNEAQGGAGRGLLLVDTPGYGFAVGDEAELQQWKRLLEAYIVSSRRLQLALVLVDCCRGLCDSDRKLLKTLSRAGVPIQLALTKCDLLTPEELAGSHDLVRAQLAEVREACAWPMGVIHSTYLASHFYAGIANLWGVISERLARIKALQAKARKDASSAET